MVANSLKTQPSPKRPDRYGRNEVPGHEQASICDWQVATRHTARDDTYQTPHRRTIRDDAIVTVPGVYLG